MEIQKKHPELEAQNWKRDLRNSYRTIPDILKRLHLNIHEAPNHLKLDSSFSLSPISSAAAFKPLVSEDFIQKIEMGNWEDPLLLQILPQGQEQESKQGFCEDAVGDLKATVYPGLIHKYHGRALLMPTSACAIHCRYCFRKEFPYEELQQPYQDPRIWSYLKETPNIQELILSGGDPLTLVDEASENSSTSNIGWVSILQHVLKTPHIKTLRIHSRIPVVLPSRITPRFLELLQMALRKGLQIVFVMHINHPQELQGLCLEKIQSLKNLKGNITLLNQAVLLKNINDNAITLKTLSQTLFQNGVLPYYLHQLDRVVGTHHFEVPVEKGHQLIQELRKELPGYLVPRYVQEIAGEPHKTVLT